MQELGGDAGLEVVNAVLAGEVAPAPQRTCWMDVELRGAVGQCLIDGVDREDAAATVEVGYIASFEVVPTGVAHSCRENGVKHQAASGR